MKKNKRIIYSLIDNLLQIFFRIIPQTERTEAWALWWGFSFRGDPKVVTLKTRQVIKVDPTDYLQCLIYYFGMFEPACVELFRKLIKDGDTVIDIGGNIGLYSIVGSPLVGPSGKVLTFEPAPFHCKSIRHHIELNNISNIELFETALGDKSGSVELVLPPNGNQGSLTIAEKSGCDGSAKTLVQVSVLDGLIKDQQIDTTNLSLIKMDIEGAELLALGGMSDVFKKLPSVLIEFNKSALARFGNSSKDLYEWFKVRGYNGWTIERDRTLVLINTGEIDFAECIWVHSTNIMHMSVIDQQVIRG